ncbi:hypothetical protein H072_2784 [Dactylellina haptotyla CBS 200.50]|uniref:Dioxygenase n=1 Tax=Dactylellina haptotyla (strain CBS 200.50) TaxID=1284197 RepID=S8AQ83_DACHA|nr:hypothetical protein H072_2784 [Dactylellina haptotyla CBS 200.50]
MTVLDNLPSPKALYRKSWPAKNAAKVEENKVSAYNDWPNDPGFDWQEETREPVQLTVTGHIPDYVRGVLYRTGPGGDKIETSKGTYKVDHWFDGFTLNHRFEIAAGNKVMYRSRRACDELLEYTRKSGSRDSYSFGQKRDPCEGFFRKIMSSFQSTPLSSIQAIGGTEHPSCRNVGVTLSPNMPGSQKLPGNSSANGHGGIATLTAKTDATTLQALDPETLEPLGIANQMSLHPDLNGQMSASHARTCPETGEFFNYNLQINGPAIYQIFKIAPDGTCTIIAKFGGANPSYIHSFFLSKKYVILCVFSSKYSWGGAKIVYTRNVADAIAPWDPSNKAKFFVVDRTGEKGVVATFETDAFFAFHSVNAYEDGNDIVLDVPAYENLDIIHTLYYSFLRSTSPDAPIKIAKFKTNYTRFRLKNIPENPDATIRIASLDFKEELGMELPVINPNYITSKHKYVYAISIRGKSSWVDGIVKYDTETRTSIYWEKHGHSPSEPIFVVDPNGKDEDDGVLLTVVLDGYTEKSYLLVLNAKDLTEIARAEMESVVSFGFHGTYVGNDKKNLLSF